MWVNATLASDAVKEVGASCSLARTADGARFGIVALDEVTNTLRFEESTNAGVSWTASHIPATGNATVCDLAYGAGGQAHVIYRDGNALAYKYVTNPGGVWSAPQLIAESGFQTISALSCSIAVGADDAPQVAFIDYAAAGGSTLTYAWKQSNGAWAAQPVDPGPPGADCSLALDGNNQPRLAYRGATNGAGRYAEFFTPDPIPAPSFTIAKVKRVTTKSSLPVKGTATQAVRIEWRVGKKGFKSQPVVAGAWTIKVKPLAPGKNKIQFRAVSAAGLRSSDKSLVIIRKR